MWTSHQLPSFVLLGLVDSLHSGTALMSLKPQVGLKPRQDTASKSTCGYLTGDPNKPRVADFGFACRVDTKNALWGFCPQTVIQASDCGLAGACVDLHRCDSVCGIADATDITTVSWYEDTWPS